MLKSRVCSPEDLCRKAAEEIPGQRRTESEVQRFHVLPDRVLRAVQVLLQSILPASRTLAVCARAEDWCVTASV